MTAFEVDDRIIAVDHIGTTGPVHGSVIQVSKFFVFVWYDREDREWLGLPEKADMYYLDSGWRAMDGEVRWRLQLVRKCAWCDHDITGQGEAHPLMYARIDGQDNWNCADRAGCMQRQDALDAAAGMRPLAEVWRIPVAMLEAAS